MAADERFQFALEVCDFLLQSPHFLLMLLLWKIIHPAGKEEHSGRGTPTRPAKECSVRSWSRVEIAHSNDADAPDSRRRCSFRRSRLNSHGEELPMATGSACVTTRWVLLLVPRPSRAAPAACAGASAALFCCARAFARPGMSNRWRTARTPSSVVMVSTLLGVQ
jgi:hypothetical protein